MVNDTSPGRLFGMIKRQIGVPADALWALIVSRNDSCADCGGRHNDVSVTIGWLGHGIANSLRNPLDSRECLAVSDKDREFVSADTKRNMRRSGLT
jgi:hypothetical protein